MNHRYLYFCVSRYIYGRKDEKDFLKEFKECFKSLKEGLKIELYILFLSFIPSMLSPHFSSSLSPFSQSTTKPMKRETWMTELPQDKPNFCGLGPRQFLRKTPTEKGDRSCWTDTPADKARKAEVSVCVCLCVCMCVCVCLCVCVCMCMYSSSCDIQEMIYAHRFLSPYLKFSLKSVNYFGLDSPPQGANTQLPSVSVFYVH